MNSSSIEESFSVHLWPWSIEISEETQYLNLDRPLQFRFLGSPVLSLKAGAQVILPSRMEEFRPLGTIFLGDIQAYEVPHGVLANNLSLKTIKVRYNKLSHAMPFSIEGSMPRYEDGDSSGEKNETTLATFVELWAQIFDDLLEEGKRADEHSNEIGWDAIYLLLKNLAHSKEPRKAIIVSIAERMHRRLPETMLRMRRILMRKREMKPVKEAADFDVGCLRWYVKQPGRTAAEKAGANKQRLLTVVRHETFNTLENRVLKDFALRCKKEAVKYRFSENKYSDAAKKSKRMRIVQKYGVLCRTALKDPLFESIDLPHHGIQPNYALQSDLRYRELWQWYKKLIRHETDEDKIWDWQTRTWADVVRLLTSVALTSYEENSAAAKEEASVKQICRSRLRLFLEQETGCRIHPGSLPGPFLYRKNASKLSEGVLDLVHPDLAKDYPEVEKLGRLGAHLYLVVSPLRSVSKKKAIIALWGVNQAGSKFQIEAPEISASASHALANHETVLGNRKPDFPNLRGLVVVSRLDLKAPRLFLEVNKTPVLEVPCDPKTWQDATAKIGMALTDILRKSE